ncbi:2-succinyl-5-enolpyruvyl-6-hydroxy-3-cyclohexene-1-carboxylic-acid synthase [Ferrimonas balearica]|uniref:2-succinyl-5-enolpyruvyl-6-hydroxy-3- cyclohexene-1-carboxylic-acid synthase n=1 Tax=Ferrimonas balearica TaxID=44012 RepID=UPI001C99AF6F|nr:2-succinyl-5-enolpyruvyl-6-hydroxy-3-cyclohexene-1-carboxylic-acid synthase [Ferrimonas balearica]MBY5994172.1 2-succinyl-5-enolpyruvyl-6-hydroxy-3-cyclohexene-1-carboxylic-acid synthase [Ferrimonas balearica]
MTTTHCAELNLLWARLMLEELHRLGVRHLCLAPGSRSTPLTLAAAGHPDLTRHTHFDERGLGFAALGLAKSSQSPVAIITTSGTAVANLYPAVVEAYQTGVPLVVLSGDRPPELIACGANQAIRQPAIFADYARRLDLPAPDQAMPPQALLAQLDQAMLDLDRPLHVNCMYREPLYPDGESVDFDDYLAPLRHWRQQDTPWNHTPPLSRSALPSASECADFGRGKGLIVVGSLAPHQQPEQILALARRLGWPVLADAQSQLRQADGVVHHLDQLFHHPQAQTLLAEAEHLLLIGGRLLSKRLMTFIAQHPWKAFWHYLDRPESLDPAHLAKRRFIGSLTLLPALPWPQDPHAGWGDALESYSDQLEQRFAELHDVGALTELSTVRLLSRTLSDDHQLFIGNSLPIRLFDMLASPKASVPAVFTNRGASGIDGLLATSCGVALANGKPTVLLVGDLSLLHDLNSLALARALTSPLVVLVLNNDGGSIFNLLPVPNETLRQDYYRLGHGFGFEGAASQFHLPYRRPDSLTQLAEALSDGLSQSGASVIEVVVPPNESAQLIVDLAQQIQGDD